MSYGFERLKEIGVQKIHNDTHVSHEIIKAILHENFEDINKIQLIGFISIFEREYNLDLSSVKEIAKEYCANREQDLKDQKNVFLVANKKATYKVYYIALAVIVFVLAIYFTINSAEQSDVKPAENKIIEQAKQHIKENEPKVLKKEVKVTPPKEPVKIKKIEKKAPVEKKVIVAKKIEKKAPIVKEKNVQKELSVIPLSKVWIGYIEIETNKKYQKVIKKALTFDVKKDWLIVLGHSHAKFNIDGKMKRYNIKGSLRLSYVNGVLRKITTDEFKALNRGHKW